MAAEAEFCLLGPLLVRCDGAVVPVTAGKQRVLLAALLLSANQAVSLDDLDEALWGEAPSASARATLQNYVKRLRQALVGTGPRGMPGTAWGTPSTTWATSPKPPPATSARSA